MVKRVNIKVTGSVGDGLKRYVLKSVGTEGAVDVYIDSHGGDVFAAQAIITALQSAADAGREVNFYVASVAASAASYIPTAVKGAKIWMAKSSQLMFHGPWGGVMGGADAMRDYASLLDRIKADIRAALASKGVAVEDEWFAEGRMKWYSAKEALDAGIADGIRNPPPDLVAADGHEPVSVWEILFGKSQSALTPGEVTAAAAGLEAVWEREARLRFGLPEDAPVKAELRPGGVVFTGIGHGLDGVLLKIPEGGDTLYTINWDGPAPGGGGSPVAEGDDTMADPVKPAETADNTAAKAEGFQSGFAEGKAKGYADGRAEGLAEGEAKGKAGALEAFGEKEALAKLGVTADMLAYAKAGYEADCAACRGAVLGVAGATFTEDELKAMPFASLKKLAGTVAAAKGDPAPKSDRSLFKPPAKDGGDVEAGSVPPPGDTF